jgi:hypothetical protein
MASIVYKKKANQLHYYVVVSARVDGKPRIVQQTYLGTAKRIAALVKDRTAPVPLSATSIDFGLPGALWLAAQQSGAFEVLESERFGYEKGASTDARARKRGLFEPADNGTQFLDEIGEIPLTLQAKLLRVLEEQSFRRLGGLKDIHPLLAHDWPGNARELRNARERAMILEDS